MSLERPRANFTGSRAFFGFVRLMRICGRLVVCDSEGTYNVFVCVEGPVVEPKAVGIGEGVSSVEGSVGNVLSSVLVTLVDRRHANLLGPSPSKSE